ncbi:MAG: oxidoreductase, partial [Candidatus Puniceispirillaceae bacterium]
MHILPPSLDSTAPFPRQNRRLRLGVVGGGRISQTQAMAARMTDRWEIVAGAFSSNPANAAQRGEEWKVEADRS